MRLPAASANGTNRVAVLVQNIAAVLGFRSKGVFDYRQSMTFALPSVLGSVVGAMVVVQLDETIFHRALAVAMVVMLLTLVFDTDKWIKEKRAGMGPISPWIIYPVFFLVGFYGGAIQAGVGFFLIAALVAVGAVAGAYAGKFLVSIAPDLWLKRSFAILLLFTAGRMLLTK